MRPPLKPIRFHAPLRDARLVTPAAAEADRATRWKQETQASYERGRMEGEQALGHQLMQQRSELMEIHNGVLASLQSLLPQLVRDSEHALAQLAFEVARKLVGNLPINAEMVENAMREAMAQVEESADMTILLHPEDLALLHRSDSPFLKPREHGPAVRLQEASDVTRGGCMIRTRFGLVDARRETKFELIQKALAT
jgi:flagellar assembly protein FliH